MAESLEPPTPMPDLADPSLRTAMNFDLADNLKRSRRAQGLLRDDDPAVIATTPVEEFVDALARLTNESPQLLRRVLSVLEAGGLITINWPEQK